MDEGLPAPDDHPSPEDLASYATRTADPVTHAIVQSHLFTCAECTAGVRELEAEDAEIVKALNDVHARAAGGGRRTALVVALIVIAVLAALLWKGI